MKKIRVHVDLNDGTKLSTTVRGESKEEVSDQILSNFESIIALNPMGNNLTGSTMLENISCLSYNPQAGAPKIIKQANYAIKIGDLVIPTVNIRSVGVGEEIA